MPGGSVNLTCVAVGSPMPYVKWTMDAVELTKEEEMPLGRNVLEVTNIRSSANYTCVAISSLGMIEATAQVTVKGMHYSLNLFRLVVLIISELGSSCNDPSLTSDISRPQIYVISANGLL